MCCVWPWVSCVWCVRCWRWVWGCRPLVALCAHALSIGGGRCVSCARGECGAYLGCRALGRRSCSLCVLWMPAVVAVEHCPALLRCVLCCAALHCSIVCSVCLYVAVLCAAPFWPLCPSVDRPVWRLLRCAALRCCVVLCTAMFRCHLRLCIALICAALRCSALCAPLWTVRCGPAAARPPALLLCAVCCAALRSSDVGSACLCVALLCSGLCAPLWTVRSPDPGHPPCVRSRTRRLTQHLSPFFLVAVVARGSAACGGIPALNVFTPAAFIA